jgi:hypothetical protein
MLCPANVLGVILAIRHRLDGISAFASVAAPRFSGGRLCLCFVGAQSAAADARQTYLATCAPSASTPWGVVIPSGVSRAFAFCAKRRDTQPRNLSSI